MERTVNRSILCPQIIGRTPEFAALALLMEQAKGGQGHIALIAGEAGIGKSRLVSELKALAMGQGFLVVQGVCFPTDLTYPYAPLLDLLRSLMATNLQASLTAAIAALAHDIFPLLPELVPDQTMPSSRLEPEQEKRRLFSVLTTFFLHLSLQAPLLLVIEDLHWSDDTSLDFLHSLARHCVSQPLLLLVTYRQDEIHPPLQNWLTQLNRERLAHEIQLDPLARNEVDTMLSVIFEERYTSFDMRRFLHGELLEALYMLTEGNPFFVEETISSLIAANDIFYTQGYWHRTSGKKGSIPKSVQDAVHQRTAQVSEAARHVLTLAAVAGRHFDFALLQHLRDAQGIAETLDLLGMTSNIGGDLIGGTAYYQHAIVLFNELGDKPGLISSLASSAERGPTFQTDSMASAGSLAEACQDAEHALKIARKIGHRSGEVYALLHVGLTLGSQGEYERTFEVMRQSVQIAEEIEHRQWQTAAHAFLSGVYCTLLALPQAREHAEQALVLARENGSLIWTRLAAGYLASVTIQLHDLAQAEKLLHTVLSPATPAETMGQRMLWCASIELALAQGQPTHALAMIDQLVASMHQSLRGKAVCVS